MAIYEYNCPKCGLLEIEQKITEEALKICPVCGKEHIERQISNTSFRLKGAGWFNTDYKQPNKSKK
jgi:putative FmdB family regulatory protein